MKYIISITLIAFVGFVQPIFAQENDSLARKSFAMAETAFANGQYNDAVSYIKYAEIYSGGANSRSLYIKIRALDQMANQDMTYIPTLQSAIDRFFEVTDKGIYPQEKYQEITSIMNRRKSQSGNGATPSGANSANASKNAAELADYQKAVKLNTIEGYKEFLDTYSYTPHYGEIKRRYDDMVEDAKEYRHHKINH